PRSTRYGSLDFLLGHLFRAAAHPPDVRTQILMGGFTPAEQHELLSDEARVACDAIDAYSDIAGVLADAPAHDELDRLIYHHAKLYLAGRTLVKWTARRWRSASKHARRISTTSSSSSRVPFRPRSSSKAGPRSTCSSE